MWVKVTNKKIEEHQRKGLYIYSQALMEMKKIDNRLKQDMLYGRFGVWSRADLTLEQLEQFVGLLEGYKCY